MLKDGLKRDLPPGTDKSMTVPPGRVNDSPTRSGPAKSPKSLGPRTA